MTTDRMERVREKAREYWSAKPGFPPAMIAALSDAEVRGAGAYRTLTDAEWEQTRDRMTNHEKVLQLTRDEWAQKREAAARSMYTDFKINLNDPSLLRDWEDIEDEDKDRWLDRADAAMMSLGFEKSNDG